MRLGSVLGLSLLLDACGDGGELSVVRGQRGLSVGGDCSMNGSAVDTTGVTENHTHTLQLTQVEINTANASAVFTTSNDSGHTHPVQLTAQDYASLANNTSVSLSTGAGGDGHTHTLTITCA